MWSVCEMVWIPTKGWAFSANSTDDKNNCLSSFNRRFECKKDVHQADPKSVDRQTMRTPKCFGAKISWKRVKRILLFKPQLLVPYSRDLAAPYFFLFSRLKRKYWNVIENIQVHVVSATKKRPVEGLLERFQNLETPFLEINRRRSVCFKDF